MLMIKLLFILFYMLVLLQSLFFKNSGMNEMALGEMIGYT